MKIKPTLLFIFGIVALALVACHRDDISFDSPTQQLAFSKDTLVLDTVYNQVRSETYAVKVYNSEDKDIKIPRISLEGGTASPYRINIDGKSGTEFSNIPLRKKDSLYIFVEIAPIATATEAIAEDRILFSTQQHITLLSVVQDAEFFVQTSDHPNILTQNTTWDNRKAKIIYGDLTVTEGKSLTIEKGTKVYFAKNSGLKISKNSTLNISGSLGEEVILRGERNDPRYDTIPVNWNSIRLEDGAVANIQHAKIFGGTNGLELHNATATVKNTLIHTFQNFGIKAVASAIEAQNMVMNNCGEADLGIFKGGNIQLNKCTLANYWQMNGALPALALSASNEWTNPNGDKEYGALTLNVQNSILYTGRSNAIQLAPTTGQSFQYTFANLLFNMDSTAGFEFDGNANISNAIKNEDPLFINYYITKMNLRLKDNSPIKGKGIGAY
ncbi:hypothetical protein BPO_1924 [Bergeyella porcorum]|uniref:Right-handed parallel beta-helix repeat-containing protein n=2 Tax=Bergeyella porcorum TaxID=1735111 RepID=A0AAU0F3P6_9FLAO